MLTRQIRAKVNLIDHLTRNIGRLSNRLRTVVVRYYPAALNVFSSLTAQITLQFIQAYSTPEAATELTFAKFQPFARQHRYPKLKALSRCFARLQEPQPEANLQRPSWFTRMRRPCWLACC